MIINKNTANRVKNYCKAIEQGLEKKLPQSAYTYSELKGSNPVEKAEYYRECKFITGSVVPSRKDIRTYNHIYLDFGNTHTKRMSNILLNKLATIERKQNV